MCILIINLKYLDYNKVELIIRYNDYKYYFGVVKANCYGHYDIKTVEKIIQGGCNYLAVATLDEALYIRKYIKNIPVLCLGSIPVQFIEKVKGIDITITINSMDYMM